MDRMVTNPRSNKCQRESHSEIERKRRERMKRDTEFLRKQLSNSQCKDKLSIFQTGAERLIRYTDKLGKREYIINDEEYSRLIMENFEGFDIHVRCSDGKILRIHPNVEKILDLPMDTIVGRSLHELAEPSGSTKQILNEAFYGSELQWDIFKGLIARNFILALRCGTSIPLRHCVTGSDNNVYRFIEFCGDLSHEGDSTSSARPVITFRGLCRPLDPACGSLVTQQTSSHGFSGTSHLSYFTLRLSPENYRIIEAVGDFQALLGYQADDLAQKQLRDLTASPYRDTVDRALSEVKTRSPITTSVQLMHMETNRPCPFELRLTSIRSGATLHCIVCRLDTIDPTPAVISESLEGASHSASLKVIDNQPSSGCLPASTFSMPSRTSTYSSSRQSDGEIGTDKEVPVQSTSYLAAEPNTPVIEQVTNDQMTVGTSPRLDLTDEWFGNVDTSGFSCFLENGRTFPECLLDILHENEGST